MRIIDLGSDVAYSDGLDAMREAMARVDVDGPALLFIEHRPTITITRRGGVGAFVSPRALIELDGIDVVEADRGGDVTYHGPGQLTGYPVLRLGDTSLGTDVVGYVRAIEAAIIDACGALGVDSAFHQEGKDDDGHVLTGVWAKEAVVADETLGCNSTAPADEIETSPPTRAKRGSVGFHVVDHRVAKVCAIGVGLGGGVTRHGFALNVTTDLERYTRHIVPCGLRARGVTSLERLLPRTPSMATVKATVAAAITARVLPRHRQPSSSPGCP